MVSQPASYQTSDRSEKNESEFELSLKKLMVEARRGIPQKYSSKSPIHLLPIRYLGISKAVQAFFSLLFPFFFFSLFMLFMVSRLHYFLFLFFFVFPLFLFIFFFFLGRRPGGGGLLHLVKRG